MVATSGTLFLMPILLAKTSDTPPGTMSALVCAEKRAIELVIAKERMSPFSSPSATV